MKKKTVALLLFSFISLYANKHDESFYEAAKVFKEGDYSRALVLYESLDGQGPVTYYNRGVVLYQLKEYAKALVFWRKAERYASPSLLKKIGYNIAKAQDALQVPRDPQWYKMLLAIQSYCSLFAFQCLFLLVWYLLWASLCFSCCFLRKIRPILIGLILLCGAVVTCKYWHLNRRQAIVVVDQAKVFPGPNSEFHELATLSKGEQVKVVGREESWYKMHCRDARGWMHEKDLEEVSV